MDAHSQQRHAQLLIDYAQQQGMEADILSLLVFTHLPTEDVQHIATFTEDDWRNYNRLRELEVFRNRPLCPSPDSPVEGSETLPEKLFFRWNKKPHFPYALYAAMSEAERIPKEFFRHRMDALFQ